MTYLIRRLVLVLASLLLLSACGDDADAPPSTDVAVEASVLDCLEPPSGRGAMAPRLVPTADSLLLTWLEPDDPAEPEIHRFLLAELVEDAWSEPVEIASGDAFFANWADVPGAVEDAAGKRFAHWLQKLGAETYAYGVELARATAAGEWEHVGLLHDDDSPTEHGFVSYVPLQEESGGVQAFWLDGRQMPEGGAMQLRTARIGGDEDNGSSTVLDDRVCECCPTDAALTAEGAVVVYRDRSEGEHRDMAIVRSIADGWSEPRTIHRDGWEIHGCPVNGPAVAASGRRVAVAWWTGAEPPRVQVAFSDDAGASFAPPFVVDNEGPLGRVDLVLENDAAIVVWMAATGEEAAEIRWRRLLADGTMSPPRIVARTSPRRSAGFPRLERWNGELFSAWVEVGEVETGTASRLHACRISSK